MSVTDETTADIPLARIDEDELVYGVSDHKKQPTFPIGEQWHAPATIWYVNTKK